MSRHCVTQPYFFQSTGRRLAVLFAHLHQRLTAPVHEWQARREIARGLGRLSESELHDIGLTCADVEAACAASLDRPASEALARAVQNRLCNW